MAQGSRVSELLRKWAEFDSAGQYLPAEELCENDPDLARELQQEIDKLQANRAGVQVGFQAAETLDLADMPGRATVDAVESVSHFRSMRYHDAGGLGEIYHAMDSDLHRGVALKFIKPAAATLPERKERFLLEAEITSQLDHPGVAPVYSAGATREGRPFYAMRFVRGQSLEAAIRHLHDDPSWVGMPKSERRQYFLQLLRHLVVVTKTIAYAHQRLIVNCDIKPLNVMLGKYGETIVLDWGEAITIDHSSATHMHSEGPLPIAKKVGGDSSSSSSHSAGGTLVYMAPERFDTAGDTISRSTDIYSLGCCLYKLLTGRDAFEATSRETLIAKIRDGQFPKPSALKSDLAKPLESICLQAMAHDPARRYPSAMDFAQDLERWLDDEPTLAHRESRLERTARWVRRNKTSSFAMVGALVIVLLFSCAAAAFMGKAWDQASDARRQCLHLSAESTASLVASGFEKRWQVLEFAASDPVLIDKIQALSKWRSGQQAVKLYEGPQTELQSHIDKLQTEWGAASQSASMLVLDEDGTMLARAPVEQNIRATIGQNFRFRDYFHGQGQDYDKSDTAVLDALHPITSPYVSIPLSSQVNNRLRLQITVPVKDKDGRVIAVLGMAVEIAAFDLPKHDPLRPLVLVDLRQTQIDGTKRDNLIVHHPMMKRQELVSVTDSAFVQRMHDMIANPTLDDGARPDESWCENYVDPLVGQRWRVALAPVRVRSRRNETQRQALELVVLAQERK